MALRSVTSEDEQTATPEDSSRYALLPAWILIPQLFLATGWLRAGVWHGIRREWWSGNDLTDFVTAQSSESILGYQVFMEVVVARAPIPIAFVVVVLQLLVGLALLANWRPMRALAIGSFLNVNFMLAGVVNPSVFYLIMASAIVSWHLDRNLSAEVKSQLMKRCAPAAAVAIALLSFEVASVHPENVTEDPALVLIFLMLLLLLMAWSIRDLDGVDDDEEDEEEVADTEVPLSD